MSTNKILASMAVEISASNARFNRSLSESQRHLGAFSKGIGAISGQLRGLVAGFGVYEIGRQIIQTTSQFQKFSAVLSNTLGSDSEAQRALNRIKDFALDTPFEVSEITAAYVRWANQGLDPTIDRMRKLGDIASSLGAGFEQTAEAFKDLAVGQTKRIEEVGISAETVGDKIKLSFKGVTIEIERNAAGVQKALDVYSQLNGVLGTSDAVAETLGGRISNLGDAWTNLMNTMGQSSSGPLFAAIQSLTNITNALANVGAELALIGQAVSPFHDLSDVSRETLDYLMKFARTDTGKRMAEIMRPFTEQSNIDFIKNYDANLKSFTQTLLREGESLEDINTLWRHYVLRRTEAARADDEAASQKRIDDFRKYVDGLKAEAAATKAVREELQALERWKASAAAPLSKGVTNKSGFDFMFDSGAMVEMANAGSDALSKLSEGLRVNSQEWAIWWSEVQARMQMATDTIQMDLGPAIAGTLTSIAAALGTASNGVENFGDAIIKSIGGFMQVFGGALIALGVGKVAFDAFSGPAMIAAGVVMAAAGAAIQTTINNRPDLSNRGGSVMSGESGYTQRRTYSDSYRDTLDLRVRGYNLVNLSSKEGRRRSQLG